MYMLLIMFKGNPIPQVMNTKEKHVAATEENKKLLIDMGEELIKDNLIIGYQLVKTAGNPVWKG